MLSLIKVFFLFLLNLNNSFLKDLYKRGAEVGRAKGTCRLILSYKEHLKEVDNFLYRKLSDADKKTFINFLLKRYIEVDTASSEDIKRIEDGFKYIRSLYDKKNSPEDPIEIPFEDKGTIYFKNKTPYENNSEVNILKNYYPAVHAFILKEYIMDGFNPENGKDILDCGAAFGDTMILFNKLYPASKVHCFECDSENTKYIKENAELNGITNYQVKDVFLYKKSGDIYIDKNFKVIDNPSDNEIKEKSLTKIKALSLDDYVKEENITNLGLLKFDIEGGELPALKGAVNTIKTQKPLIYVPIYHLQEDIYEIPKFIDSLSMKYEYKLKWTEKRVEGVDCVLFVKFI